MANIIDLSFYEIVRRLNTLHDAGWTVEPTDEYIRDQRLLDERVAIAALSARL